MDDVRRVRHSRLVVARINTTAVAALDSKAALALSIPSNSRAQNATISTGAWDELVLSACNCNQILRRGHSDSRLLEGDTVVDNDGSHRHVFR